MKFPFSTDTILFALPVLLLLSTFQATASAAVVEKLETQLRRNLLSSYDRETLPVDNGSAPLILNYQLYLYELLTVVSALDCLADSLDVCLTDCLAGCLTH